MKIHLLFVAVIIFSWYENLTAQVDFLIVRDGFVDANGTTQPAEIILANQHELRGIQFDLEYDPGLFTLTSLSGLNRITGFDVFFNEVEPGLASVLITDLNGEMIAPASEAILSLDGSVFNTSQALAIHIRNVLFSNALGQGLFGSGAGGYLFASGTNIIRVANGHEKVEGDTITVDLYNEVDLGGLQLTLLYPHHFVRIHSLEKTSRSNAMELNMNSPESGEMIVTLTSTQANMIEAGTGPTLKFVADSIGTLPPRTNEHQLMLDNVVLSNAIGEAVPHEQFDGTFLRDIPILPVSVKDDLTLPRQASLSQNYPNPFNPETRIDFEIPTASHVTIRVFNLLGQEVQTLQDEFYPEGNYSVIWDGRTTDNSPVNSGVYIIQLRAGDFVANRKAILIK